MEPDTAFQISLVNDHIVVVRVAEKAEIDIDEVMAIKQGIIDITQGSPYASLVISGRSSSISQEAMKLTASEEYAKNRLAMALIVDNLPHRIVANFYIKFNKPSTPTRVFTKESTAMDWLQRKTKETLV